MFNPFKKAKSQASNMAMGMMAKVAMKKLQKMSPQEQQKIMREAMNPKNKDKMLVMMEQMRAAGQITDEQFRMAKKKMGL
jgi:hypothetical protein